MSIPIAIYRNKDLIFDAKNIQEYLFVTSKETASKRRKELEDRGHKNARRFWLMPANPNDYDVEGAFTYYDTIDWKRSYNYENGDIIFVYVSGNIKKVRFKVEVVEGIVRDDEIINDDTYWLDEEKYKHSQGYNRSRIRLINEVDTEELSLEKLREYGLKGNIQGSMNISGELLDYITSFFRHDLTEGYYPDQVADTLEEGKRKTISVNIYERNPIARKQCVGYYGAQCQVCNINFEDTYGEIGEDFIHVHHIVPLYEIKKDYIVNPKEDLIPVCPNCHAMLHRKENGIYLSVGQLRERISKNKCSI